GTAFGLVDRRRSVRLAVDSRLRPVAVAVYAASHGRLRGAVYRGSGRELGPRNSVRRRGDDAGETRGTIHGFGDGVRLNGRGSGGNALQRRSGPRSGGSGDSWIVALDVARLPARHISGIAAQGPQS